MADTIKVDIYDPRTRTYSKGYAIDGKTYFDETGTKRIDDSIYVKGGDGKVWQKWGDSGSLVEYDVTPWSEHPRDAAGPIPQSTTTPATTGYVPQGTYHDSGMSAADKALVEDYQKQWKEQTALGNTEAAANLHNLAEGVRAKYGYSGGQDGSNYIPLSPGSPNGQNTTLDDTDKYINEIYDQKTKAVIKALEAAYQQNVNAANAARAAIPGTYNDARNSTASQAAIGQQNFNEKAAASGLNSGTGGQAALAMNNTLQSNISNLDRQQAKDISAVDLQLAQVKAKYEGDIAAAIADGQFQKAQALYSKYMTDQDNAIKQKQFDAQMSASNDTANYNRSITYAQTTGDYSSLSPWWTHQAIKNAVSTFAASMRQQKSSSNDIAVYLTRAVNGGSISQQEAAEILQILGLT